MNEVPNISSRIGLEGNLEIPLDSPPIDYVDDIRIEIQITNQKFEHTCHEQGENITEAEQYQLIVNGVAEFQMKYLAPSPDTGLHTVCFEVPFENLIDWPDNNLQVKIKPVIEHAFFKQFDSRTIYQAVAIRLDFLI